MVGKNMTTLRNPRGGSEEGAVKEHIGRAEDQEQKEPGGREEKQLKAGKESEKEN